MASGVAEVPLRAAPPGVVRLSGTDLSPRWRGRLHLGAFLLSGPAAATLIWREHSTAVTVYAVSLVAMYAVSAGYHLLPLSPLRRNRMRRADHAMIYVFTAGSYTPFCLQVVDGSLGIAVLALAMGALYRGGVVVLFTRRATRWPPTGAACRTCSRRRASSWAC
jgi:hemolysin III